MPTIQEASALLRVPEGIIRHHIALFSEYFLDPSGELSATEMSFLEIIRDGKSSEVATERDIRERLPPPSPGRPVETDPARLPVARPRFAEDSGHRPVTRDDMVALVSSLATVIGELREEVRSLRQQMSPSPRPGLQALPPPRPVLHPGPPMSRLRRLWLSLFDPVALRQNREPQLA